MDMWLGWDACQHYLKAMCGNVPEESEGGNNSCTNQWWSTATQLLPSPAESLLEHPVTQKLSLCQCWVISLIPLLGHLTAGFPVAKYPLWLTYAVLCQSKCIRGITQYGGFATVFFPWFVQQTFMRVFTLLSSGHKHEWAIIAALQRATKPNLRFTQWDPGHSIPVTRFCSAQQMHLSRFSPFLPLISPVSRSHLLSIMFWHQIIGRWVVTHFVQSLLPS